MDNKNEMEQIQRGLEDFLEKEMGHAGKTTHGGQGVPTGEQPGRTARGRDTEDSVRIIGQRANAQEIDYGRDTCSRNEGTGSRSCGTEEFHRPGYDEEEAEPERRFYDWDSEAYSEHTDDWDSEEDPESDVYDWDSEAPRRRNPGRERPHIRTDSGRDMNHGQAGYSHGDYEAEDGYGRGGYGQEGRYARRGREAEDGYGRGGYGQEGRDERRERGPEGRYAHRGREAEDGYERDGYEQEGRYAHGDYESEGRPARRGHEQEYGHARHDSGQEGYSGRSPRADGQKRGREQPKGKGSDRQARTHEEDYQVAKKASKSQKSQKKKKKKHRLLKFLIVAALIFILLGAGLYKLVGVVYGKMNYHEIASLANAPMKEDGVVNVLLIGNDSRENGEDGRSDAMILLSVSTKTKKIYMTSLLRDMYVDIPGHDGNRLNAAYSFGGAELLMETIEQNLDITVNRYVLVNFEAFANLVDAVGGIELELSSEEIEYVNGYLVEYNILTDRPQGTDNMDTSVSGLVHLNGPQALAYSRNRYLGTDFGRTDRQRKVLTAVIKKLPSALVSNPGGLIDGLMPNLTTNLTRGECFSLSLMAGKMLTYDIESDSIPQPGTYRDVTIRKMSVLEVDFETNIRYLREKLYGE